MNWAEVCIHTTKEAEDAISHILYEQGAQGIIIEDINDILHQKGRFGEIYDVDSSKYPQNGIHIKVYFPEDHLFQKKITKIEEAIKNLIHFDMDIGIFKLTINQVKESDWETSWQKYYLPTPITKRITIVPKWHDYQPKSEDELIVTLDPGMAFGTGTHPTTRLSIIGLEKYLKKDDFVIDVGSGSGILSIVSQLLGANRVLALDLDPVAVKSTRLNLALNHIDSFVDVRQNDLLKDINEEVDLIVSNILAEIILQMIDDVYRNLKNDGLFIASGIIDQKKKDVIEKLEQIGFRVIEILKMDHWNAIIAQK